MPVPSNQRTCCNNCVFRPGTQRLLDEAGVDWEQAVDSESDRTVEATVAADLAFPNDRVSGP